MIWPSFALGLDVISVKKTSRYAEIEQTPVGSNSHVADVHGQTWTMRGKMVMLCKGCNCSNDRW